MLTPIDFHSVWNQSACYSAPCRTPRILFLTPICLFERGLPVGHDLIKNPHPADEESPITQSE